MTAQLAMKEAINNSLHELYCGYCGGIHPGECRNILHCQKNEEYGLLFHESVWGQKWIETGTPKIIKGYMLRQGDDKKWRLVHVDRVSENNNIDDSYEIETINISALYDSAKQDANDRAWQDSRAQRRRRKRKGMEEWSGPRANINSNEASTLLDSGAINRNFISQTCIQRLNLISNPMKNKIKVTSIHGHEIATHSVKLNVQINAYGESAELGEIEMVVLKETPAETVIGFPTLTENRVFSKLTRHFNTGGQGHTGWTRDSPDDAQRRKPSWKRVNAALSALGASKAERKQYKKIHISELLNQIPETDPTEELLPEDIWNSYLQDPDRAGEQIPEDIKFDVHGTESEKRAITALLNKYIDVFSSRVRTEPALITPMKIDVDFAAWERDRRSREPTRPQTAARQAAIEKWLRQAIADKVIRQSEAKAWSQLHLTPKPNGQWRFNVDYRALNKYTRAARTLIPNIADL
jgi:Retroviral aspartyl protease